MRERERGSGRERESHFTLGWGGGEKSVIVSSGMQSHKNPTHERDEKDRWMGGQEEKALYMGKEVRDKKESKSERERDKMGGGGVPVERIKEKD